MILSIYDKCPKCAEHNADHLLAWTQDKPISGLKMWVIVCKLCAFRIVNDPNTEQFLRHDFILLNRVDRG